MTAPTGHERTCRHIVFEALFQHGLKGDEALFEGLRTAGFDVKAPRPEYPLRVFGDCLSVAIRQRYGNDPSPETYTTLGTKFIEGILATMLGKVVGTALLLSGPDRTLKRMPTLIQSDYGLSVTTTRLGPRHYEMASEGGLPTWAGFFIKGIVEGALRKTRSVPSTGVKPGEAHGSFVLNVTWAQ